MRLCLVGVHDGAVAGSFHKDSFRIMALARGPQDVDRSPKEPQAAAVSWLEVLSKDWLLKGELREIR